MCRDRRSRSGGDPLTNLRSQPPCPGAATGSGAPQVYPAARFSGAFGSTDEDDFKQEFDSGEEEKPSDDGDSDFAMHRNLNLNGRLRSHSTFVVPSQADRMSALTTPTVGSSVLLSQQGLTASHPSTSRTNSSMRTDARTIRPSRPSAPAPIPVPNLTKKSRGRRVPTHPGVALNSDGGVKRTRGYMCRVPGCGKCFARGEHLKRHVRSIHTNEKRESDTIWPS